MSTTSNKNPRNIQNIGELLRTAEDSLRNNVSNVKELFISRLTISKDRLQEIMDEAVGRGRLTRDDANELMQKMVTRGRRQTEDVLAEIEGLVNRGVGQIEQSANVMLERLERMRAASSPNGTTASSNTAAGNDVLPIEDYDQLTAKAVIDVLDQLNDSELRLVEAYEKRNANRKTVINAIEKQRAA